MKWPDSYRSFGWKPAAELAGFLCSSGLVLVDHKQLVDPVTGKTQKVYVFVACLPFSRYAFVEPTLDMQQNTWLAAHVAMFEFFGGSVPRIVCDNLKPE